MIKNMSKKTGFCRYSDDNDNYFFMGTKVVQFCARLESDGPPTTTTTVATRSLREGYIYLETKALSALQFQRSCLSLFEEIRDY